MALAEIISFPKSAPVFRVEDHGRSLLQALKKPTRKALSALWRESWSEAKRSGDLLEEVFAVHQLSRLHGPGRVERILDRLKGLENSNLVS